MRFSMACVIKVEALCCIAFVLLPVLVQSKLLSVPEGTKRLYLTEATRQDTRFVQCDSNDMKMSFPNLDYAFAGYDVVKGYPLTTARDPGFRRAIFKADYKNGQSNGDCRYILPKGINAVADVSCDVSFKSDIIKTKSEFYKSLSVSANVQGGGSGFEFSASASYQKATSEMSSKEFVYIISKAQCTSYFSRIRYRSPPPFDEGFLDAAKVLASSQSTDQDVQNFVDNFGTHFADEVTFGSSYTQEHRMSTSTFDTLSNKKFGVGVQASYSGSFSVGGGFNMDSEQRQAASNFAKSVETSTVTVGSAPPSNGDAMTWASVVKENPVPIKYNLRPIADLFTERFVNDSIIMGYNKIHQKLSNAPLKSCQQLKSQGVQVTCEAIKEAEDTTNSDLVIITGGYPDGASGSPHPYYTFVKGNTLSCELMCNVNDECVGYVDSTIVGIDTCRLVLNSALKHKWTKPPNQSSIRIQPFKLYLNKMKQDIVLSNTVPKTKDGQKILFAYGIDLSDSKNRDEINECRNICLKDPLCKAIRYGAGDKGCHVYHQISTLPSETVRNTEFRFVARQD